MSLLSTHAERLLDETQLITLGKTGAPTPAAAPTRSSSAVMLCRAEISPQTGSSMRAKAALGLPQRVYRDIVNEVILCKL